MSDKKIINSKVWIFFDWVWRLMVLNVLVLVTSIGIITIVPAICAAFKSIKDCKENYTSKIIKPFFQNFVYLFRDTFLFSIILLIIIGICGYGFLWYDGAIGSTQGSGETMDQTWFTISLIAIVIIVVGVFVVGTALIQIPMVINYFYYGFIDNVKLCFYMAYKYFITSLIEIFVVGLSAFILLNALFIYALMPVWLFFGISLPLYVMYIVSRRFYRYVSENTEDDEEIDYQGKTINRETYEDETKTIKGDNND